MTKVPDIALFTEEDLDVQVLAMAKENHIWLNAMACIKPTDKFKIELAEQILEMLGQRDNLLPSGVGRLGELTPMLYLSINKS